MINANTLNNSLTATIERARPLSHLAAATLLVTSIYAVHEGAASILPAGLVVATTAAMIGMEWLQWTGLGRIAKLDDAGEHTRASVLKLQCAGIAVLQVILYTLAVVAFAKAGGADWSQGWALFGSIGIAALYAGLNFVAKWTSCDPVGEKAAASSGGPTGGQRVHDVLFSTPAPALPAPAAEIEDDETNILRFVDRVRHTNAKFEKDAAAEPARPTPVRLRLAAKRLQTRAWREQKRAAG
jgi:hypothetical protein